MRGRRLALLVALAVVPAAARAQDALIRGLDLERQGRWADAAAAFGTVLARDPANPGALLGAERVYLQLGRRDSMQVLVTRALAVDSTGTIVRQVQLRQARAVGGEDAAAVVLHQWMAAAPHAEGPYRELIRALLGVGKVPEARQAVTAARAALGPNALRPEAALVDVQGGDWPAAGLEWRAGVATDPAMLTAAVFNLQAAPANLRAGLVRALTEPDTGTAGQRVAAELLLGWHDAPRAWTLLQRTLPSSGAPQQAQALRSFAERARAQPGQASQRVAGEALERLASGMSGAGAARVRVESARAFWAGGDDAAAQRLLRAIADDANSPPDVAAASIGTLIEMASRSGDVAGAADLLERRRALLPAGEALQFGLIIARGWLARGQLDRADQAVAADSSLSGDEIRGWTALYRGNVKEARVLLRASGSRTTDADVAARAAVVALLQAVDQDSSPALGAALLTAARGDTLGAARALGALARGRDPVAARPDAQAALLASGGRFALAANDTALADSMFTDVLTRLPATSQAPAAMLMVARLATAKGDSAGAATQLEAMILRYPESALVPEARRELERVRGRTP